MYGKGHMNLKAARLKMGATQTQVAKLSGISREKYSRIEAGTSDPTPKQAAAICETLGLESLDQPVMA